MKYFQCDSYENISVTMSNRRQGRRQDPIRNSFETIATSANLGKGPEQQHVRCKVCMEKVSARVPRLKEHRNKCQANLQVKS